MDKFVATATVWPYTGRTLGPGKTSRGLQLDSGQATGAGALMEPSMNVLSLIKNQHGRKQRLSEAQKIHLKAYRGVPYREAPRQDHVDTDLTYRGQPYHAHR